jgi:hypothetical protein
MPSRPPESSKIHVELVSAEAVAVVEDSLFFCLLYPAEE